ncbi:MULTISPECIES: DUF3199 family protein [unclassified Dehalobacter]|uniref:protein YqbG n=1 Tax=unclassified Dehalobacter TaxID=2635733 RepID=UPI00104381A9|nr:MULTISPECIES: DUF3199 family protein [unclassified Dehalobacter]TCX51932.1 hypothetical protein C1I36_06340 [Dehalobacter sp. 14DCB1]TCX52992.1 hypothetical protein C1I38_08020 [Dehalobacter sp. 12DCB1]
MATRPWVTPAEVKDYTEFETVQNRPDAKLLVDIARAENYIIHRTNNDFTDVEKYQTIPEDIKIATKLVAEFYATTAPQDPQKKYQSETFKDYSYTITSGSDKSADDLDISALIAAYVKPASTGTLNMKMRKL